MNFSLLLILFDYKFDYLYFYHPNFDKIKLDKNLNLSWTHQNQIKFAVRSKMESLPNNNWAL